MKSAARAAWTEAITKKAAKKEGRVKNVRKKVIDGITFDSTREARRYQDLVLMQKAGTISQLRRQVPYGILINGVLICTWVADFVYMGPDGRRVVEDTKGWKTDIYKLKKKMFEAYYNAKIKQETKAIKNDGAPNASERAADAQKKLDAEKSGELKKLFGITDEKIKALVGGSYIDWKQTGEQTYFAAKVFFKAQEREVETIIALDNAITDKFPDKSGMLPIEAQIKIFENPTGIPQGWLGVAPGPKTAKLIAEKVKDSQLLIMAGPLCIEEPRVEQLSQANRIVFEGIRIAKEKGGITVGAGGDTAAAIRQNKGENSFTLISNAGGATLELIEKGTSVGLDAVQKASEIWKQKHAG